MRLLNTHTRESSDVFDNYRPLYAILSHTWASTEDEVSLQDYRRRHDSGSTIPWRYCIDKTSSAELSEAINSMFNWYRNSGVYYTLLSDVPDESEDVFAPDSAFRPITWFTRGWTLQELQAPRLIRFRRMTSILQDYFLRAGGLRLSDANVAARMSWASTRKTTRVEEAAYCLMGIFNVNMPLLHGDGPAAFVQFQEEILKRTHDHTLLASE
ncbi:hypothetical protein G7046_g4202 [Stylonectria norvegica]|nr:hypothetical protein G7046_g4202 [Stylonectria norvegica]